MSASSVHSPTVASPLSANMSGAGPSKAIADPLVGSESDRPQKIRGLVFPGPG
jgi:hypothetical protein